MIGFNQRRKASLILQTEKSEGIVFDFTKFEEERLKMNKPRINVVMSAYNTMPLVKAAFESIQPYADLIFLTEGAWNPKASEKHSTDGTLEYLMDKHIHNPNVLLFEGFDFNLENRPYPYYVCEEHENFVKNAIHHPYFDGKSLQSLMLTRHFAMDYIRKYWKDRNKDPGWYWLVDSDEIYTPESIENLIEFLTIVQDDYDFFTIRAKTFYFDYQHYATEWYRRLFRIKPDSFFSDDNSMDTPEGAYQRTMDVPPEICEFFHYCYVGKQRVDKKLEIWNKDAVTRWKDKHDTLLTGQESYQGGGVHLFGDTNKGYSNYTLTKFEDEHPSIMKDIINKEKQNV
jgi:hypothetical protein